ncbi:helix-turn-helix domain-containing protein [Polymorphum gilvum]|uniref:Transcriptional regulator, AraC family n=1 Tax=Polymorphum gilvum (strain LMG 25793 / CGMCC 1.9160 / SL003B-26A1) TaxID=991905 RepID=F2IWX3_POLGS|nr:AraC family transcriptional regulator [Polymorphum gilvum]ADZ71550.1 Transcriptional regulator, AraC family [Polymorphum gilvum SL003B-26A1]
MDPLLDSRGRGILVPGQPQAIEVLPDTEAVSIHTALSPVAWTLRGTRNRAFILVTGQGELDMGATLLPLTGPCALWLPAGRPARLKLKSGSRGAALTVPELALGRAVPSGPVGRQVRDALFHPIIGTRLTPALALDIAQSIEAVGQELRSGQPGAQEAARHHLVLVLMALWRISSPQPLKVQAAPRTIVRNFLHLMELHLRDHWTVADYARFLSVSRARLTSAVKRATGRTPLELLHERLVIEAETLLAESHLQVTEIADALGFKDPGYFNRFFKRETGRPPGRVRKAEGRMPIHRPNFAEWP